MQTVHGYLAFFRRWKRDSPTFTKADATALAILERWERSTSRNLSSQL